MKNLSDFAAMARRFDPDEWLTPGLDYQTSSVARAALVAAAVHANQVDKSGRPYIKHPRRVYLNAMAAFDSGMHQLATEYERVSVLEAAWLHDVIEDSEEAFAHAVTASELLDLGFANPGIEIVELLTREPATADTYYQRIASNPWARLVKLADIADNTDPRRVAALPAGQSARLSQKYQHALAALAADQAELSRYRAQLTDEDY